MKTSLVNKYEFWTGSNKILESRLLRRYTDSWIKGKINKNAYIYVHAYVYANIHTYFIFYLEF